jgi:hypothetical protein
MNETQITDYLDYWMEKDQNFSQILSNNEYYVEDVEHYDDSGYPRSAISLNKNLTLLFPPYQTGFDYSLFNNNHPFKNN